MVKSFEDFKSINEIEDLNERQRLWMKRYDNLHLNYSRGSDSKIPEEELNKGRGYKDDRFEPEINLMQRKKNELTIDFDDNDFSKDEKSGAMLSIKDDKKIEENINKAIMKLKGRDIGYIRSSHKGHGDHVTVQFIRDVTQKEAEQFLEFIRPKKDNKIDFNFADDNYVLPILFAKHWKTGEREMPVEFYEGDMVDFDKLGLYTIKPNINTSWKNGFGYKTSKDEEKDEELGLIWDEDKILKQRYFPIDCHNDKLFFGLLMPKNVIKWRKNEVGKMEKDGIKQSTAPYIITGAKRFTEIDEKVKKEYSIDFYEIPTALPQRWDLKLLKAYVDGKKSPVVGIDLFNKISNKYKEYLSIRRDEWYGIYTLWDIGTYMYPVFEAYPLIENRGIAGTGKSKSMDISSMITFNGGQLMVNPSEATLFRETEEVRGTKYFDEAEKLWVFNKNTKQMEGDTRTELINASYTKSAKVPRQEKVGTKFVTKWYTPYSPTQLSSINGLFGATEQRAITRICTKSSNKDNRGETEPREDRNMPVWGEIRDECYRFALENYQDIRKIYSSFNGDCGLKRRDLQIWKPLLSIAKHISDEIYNKILSFAISISNRMIADMIPESSFDYVCLKAFGMAIESSQDRVYVTGIKSNYCAIKGVDSSGSDIYLNRNISNHLDKLGFRDFREKDRHGAYYKVCIDLFNEIIAPICPGLIVTLSSHENDPKMTDLSVKPVLEDQNVTMVTIKPCFLIKENFDGEIDEKKEQNESKKIKYLSSPSSRIVTLSVKQLKLGDDSVTIRDDKNKVPSEPEVSND